MNLMLDFLKIIIPLIIGFYLGGISKRMFFAHEKKEESRELFLKMLYFFKDNWGSLRYRIENRNMVHPQNGEFEWCGTKINEALNNAKVNGFKFDKHIDETLCEIANNLRNLGSNVRKTKFISASEVDLKCLIEDGEEIYESLKGVLDDAEKSVKIKWYRYFMPF